MAQTIIQRGAGGPALTDGDKGDITVSSSGTVFTIDARAVTFAKIEEVPSESVMLRGALGNGSIEEGSIDATLQVTTAAVLRRTAISGVIDIPTGSNVAAYVDGSMTLAKIVNIAASRIVGRGSAGAGPPIELTAGNGITINSNQVEASTNVRTHTIPFTVDGGGSAITTGAKKAYWSPQHAGTITSWRILLDQSGSIVFDIWKDTYANYPPTVADTITASAKPTVTTATKAESSTLTGWTTSFSAGDVFEINVDSITTATKAILLLTYTVA